MTPEEREAEDIRVRAVVAVEEALRGRTVFTLERALTLAENHVLRQERMLWDAKRNVRSLEEELLSK